MSKELNDALKEFDQSDLLNFVDFASHAAAYGYIANNTQEYLRNIDIMDLLNNKFTDFKKFSSATELQNFVRNKLLIDQVSPNYVYRYLQGQGAGEVDFIRHINGSLKGLLYKADYATNEAGNIASNIGGIDAVIKNRFTDEIIYKVQIKSNWSATPGNLRKAINRFKRNKFYSPDIVLLGPKELIDKAKEMGLPNPTMTFKDTSKNLKSAEKLTKLAADGKMPTSIYSINTVQKIGKGAATGAVVSLGVSSIENYVLYKQGMIDMEEAFDNIAKDSAKGAFVGGALKGVALICPPGLIGVGIVIAVGSGLRKTIDLSLGKGEFEKILLEMQIDHNLTRAYTNFAITTTQAFIAQKEFAQMMNIYANNSKIIDHCDQKLDAEIEIRLKER